jgi:TPP-dependent pyruvate/acetoin dehydrogenase alpha subunit
MTCTTERSAVSVRDQLELYRRMWVLRLLDMALEESRIEGLIDGPTQAAFGQEALAVGTTAALRPGDIVTTTIPHLRHAQQVGLALPLGPAIAEMIGPSRGGGRAESPSVADWKHGLSSFPNTLGQSTLFAVGDAYTQQRAGAGAVTLCVIGDRDADSAEFTAAANIAMSWRLPVVFVIENIRGARSARQDSYVRDCHGLPVVSVDGNDVEAVRDSVAEAVQRASAGGGPTVVEAVTHRATESDSVGYLDPLVFARRRLIGDGIGASHLYEVERRARHLVAEAEAFAKARLRAGEPETVRQPETWSAAS